MNSLLMSVKETNFKPSRCIQASLYISEEWLNLLYLWVLERKFAWSCFKDNNYFFDLPLTSNYKIILIY